jgi:hypothetical protein
MKSFLNSQCFCQFVNDFNIQFAAFRLGFLYRRNNNLTIRNCRSHVLIGVRRQ